MTLVFNELSANHGTLSRQAARSYMTNMARAVARLAGPESVTLVAVCNFHETLVSHEYTVAHWLRDPAADRDVRAFLRRISAKVVTDAGVSDAVRDRFYLSEFRAETEEARGLGLAHLLRTVGVSLASADRWRQVAVSVRHVWLDIDALEHEETISVRNLSNTAHVETLREMMLRQVQGDLRGRPSTLADRKDECFPHLRFGRDVDAQIGGLSGVVLNQVIGTLIVLDGIVRDWRRHQSDPRASPRISGESQATMNKYGEERIFGTADGGAAVFAWHARVGISHRVHLRLVHENRSMEIGYIGVHLRTKKFHS